MHRVRWLTAALALLVATAAPAQRSDEPATQHSGAWWSWWSWIDDLFGSSFGGVSYGAGGPDRIIGSDQLVHQERSIAGVRGIELRGPIELVVRQGRTEKLTLHTDDNIAALIETSVEDGVLRVGVRSGANFRTKHPIGATVALPHLGALRSLGSGNVTCAGIDTDLIEITAGGPGEVRIEDLRSAAITVLVRGSGSVHLSGTAAKQAYAIEGSGQVDADELVGRTVTVRIAGSGDAVLWATESLTVDIAGSGNVRYRGQPALTTSLRGSGQLIHR